MAWKKIANKGDIAVGQGKQIEVEGETLALFNIDGKFYCINGKCTHRRGPLGEGELDGKIVTCPLHGAKFDVTTGKVEGPPAKESEPCYKVRVEGDDVMVDL